MKNLYTLIGKTNLDEAVKVEPIHIESFVSVKEVVKVKEPKKMIKTLFLLRVLIGTRMIVIIKGMKLRRRQR